MYEPFTWLVLAKKFTSMESQFDVVVEDLFNASIKLEEKEKVWTDCTTYLIHNLRDLSPS